MLFTTKWLATILPQYEGDVSDAEPFQKVFIDSRQQVNRSLFIPIEGERFDGHDFVEQAIENGAIAFLWEEGKSLPKPLPSDVIIYYVEDTLKALQKLAIAYRQKIKPYIIGITGSNGKTTTKDITTSIVKTTYKTHHTEGNFNNHIGLPLSILNMPKDTEVLVLEMGMNRFGEIEKLSKIAKPQVGMIINIGESHIEFLGSREGIAKAKLEILSGLKQDGCLILDGDEPLLKQAHSYPSTILCGFNKENDLQIKTIQTEKDQKTSFTLSDGETYQIPLIGEYHALNATYAIALAKHMNIPNENIHRGLSELELSGMRMELIKGHQGVTVINDAYNASPTSMKAAIDVVKKMRGFSKKILVLGDILELGEKSLFYHRKMAEEIDSKIHFLFTFGDEVVTMTEEVKRKNDSTFCQHFESKRDLLDALLPHLGEGTLILFKASRGMQFETLVKAIQ